MHLVAGLGDVRGAAHMVSCHTRMEEQSDGSKLYFGTGEPRVCMKYPAPRRFGIDCFFCILSG